jgi:hypothetical protein
MNPRGDVGSSEQYNVRGGSKSSPNENGKEFFSTVAAEKPVLFNIMIHQWKIRIDFQQSA